MDMINNVGHRARSNAIAQHKLKMQLLAEQKVTIEKKEEKHNAKEAAKKDVSGKNLKKAVYQGVDITSRTAVDKDLKKTLKRGGRAAVEKQVDQLRRKSLLTRESSHRTARRPGTSRPRRACRRRQPR